MYITVEIGKNIVSIRESRGYTQEHLALECNMSISYLRRIEHGTANPSVGALLRIANALGVDLVNLFCVPELAEITG